MKWSYWRDPFPLNHDCGRKSCWRWKKASAIHLFYNSAICNDRRRPDLEWSFFPQLPWSPEFGTFSEQIFGNKKTHCQTRSLGPSLPSSNYLVKTFPRIIWKTTGYRHWVIAVEEHIPSRTSLYLLSGKPEQKVVFPTPDTQCMLNVWCIYIPSFG